MLAGYSYFSLRIVQVVLFQMDRGLGAVGTGVLLRTYCHMVVQARIGSCSISSIVINKRDCTPLFSLQVQFALSETPHTLS